MSWLGANLNISDSLSSLSNITGQISNFTREMLTEGTEEVADPSAELNVARQEIRELNDALENQKIEYERLTKINDELHESVEAANLQARQVVKDYREQLMQKESRYDSTDSIGEHEELKQLRHEIVRLQTECHHWKTLSSSEASQDKLHREIDQHQHELAALQSTYSQKIANLSKKHKLEMQKWDDEKQGYLRKMEDLQHELNILEEVDNLEGMKSISSGDDIDALKEELDLARDTITKHRQQLEKAAESFRRKEDELAKIRKELEVSTSELSKTKEQLVTKNEAKKAEPHHKTVDVQTLQERLAERENTLASLSNEINLLKEQLQEKDAEIESIGDERDQLQTKENNLRSYLIEVKQDLAALNSSTLELLEELEISQGAQHEQRIEIESLRKVCLVGGDAKDEIIHLKTIISALWDRYLAALQLYQKVRHDLHSSNQRLMAQLKARHVMNPSNFSALADSKQEELAYAACQLLLSLIADKERIVEITEKLANNQSIRQQVADVKAKLNNSNSKRQEKVLQEKDQLLQKSSELRSRIDEQESLVEDLRADNQQVFLETKELIAEIGCQTTNDSIDEGNDLIVSLQAEKSVLESTIVGLQNKVQELREQVRVLEGKPVRTETVSDFDFEEKGLDGFDIVETEVEFMDSIPLDAENSLSKAEEPQSSLEERRRIDDYERVITQLNEQVEEYRTNVEDFEYIKSDLENDKSALEQVVIDLKTQIKQLRESIRKQQETRAATSAEESKALVSLQQENDELLKQRVDLIKSFRSLEDEMVSCEIISPFDVYEFENEIERAEVLRLHMKEWVIRTRIALREAEERQENDESTMSISLEEKSLLEQEYQDAKKALEELELDSSLLREQTSNLINQIEAKTTEVELINAQLEEKCYEVKNFEVSKQSMMTMINERDEKILEMQESFDSQMLDISSSNENDIEMLRAEQDGMFQLLNEKNKESQNYKKANEELMNSFQEKQQTLEDLSMQNESLSEYVRESETLLRDLRNEKENLLALLESKEQLVNSLTEESKVLAVEKDDLNESVHEIQFKLHAKEKELTEVSHLQFEVEQLGLQAKDSEFNRKSLEDRIGFLSADNERLNTSLGEKNFAVGVLEQELQDKRTEFEHLELEMDKLNELVGSNAATRREFEHQMSSLRRKKEELEKHLEEQESTIDTLKLDFREKGAENDLLRLDVARISKTLKEKEGLLQSQAGSVSVDGGQDSQGQISRMIRLLQEKDQEIDAMKQKEASLIAAVNQTDQSSHEAIDHYIQQITHLTEETNRLMAEVDRKDEQLLSMNDRLEVLQDKMSGKAQASVVLQGEHSRLLALNESQGNEIAKMREKNDYMLKLLDEKEKSKHDDLNRLQNEFMYEINGLRQEHERLLTLISEKDRQIIALTDAATPVMASQVHSGQSPLGDLWQHQDSSNQQERISRNALQVREQQISVLEGQLLNLNRNLSEKSETNELLEKELHALRSSSETLKNELNDLRNKSSSLGEKENRISHLEGEVRTLNETLNSRQIELDVVQESHSNIKESLSLENENLRLEKEELLHTTNKEITEVKNKLIKALNSLGDCNFSLSGGFEDVSKNYSGIIQRLMNQRNIVLREKDNEIRTLKNQISSLNVLTQSSDSRDFELTEVLREKEELSRQIMQIQNEKEDLLQERESVVADLQSQIISLTKAVTEKERSKGLDVERLYREKERVEKETEKLRIEREKNEREFEKLSSENNRLLNLVAEEKSNAAKLHTNGEQYQQVLQDKDNRINELSRDKDELTRKIDGFQERISVLQNDLSKANGGQKESQAKSSRELDRLREHLIQVEESYTREALEAEEREKELRIRLIQAEEQILSSSHSMHDRSRQTSQQLDSLQEQLHAVAGQRDEAVMQCAAVQEQAQQYATSLDNLQMVLEQFQREKEAQFSVERDNAQHQIHAARTEVMQMQQRENQLRVQLQNVSMIEPELNRLKQEIATRDEEILQHKTTVSKLEDDLRVSHNVIKDMNNSNDNKVDKTLLRNLLNGYFNTPEGKRADVLHVVGGLLGFSQEELTKIGTGSSAPSQGGWISSFLPFGGTPRSPTTKKTLDVDKSFSELFVNFLQHESDTAATPLQGRRGNATNPLLSGMSSNAIPLAQPPKERRNPLASSTPISKHAAPISVTGPVSMPTTPAGPVPSAAHIVNPGLSMGLGMSPINPIIQPGMAANHSTPKPSNIMDPMNTRPQAFQGTPTSANPLLVGSMAPVQTLPSITSSGPSSLRNVLFQSGTK
ncbi:hypothetical protein QZH41_013466 [Actinostola sp. cb2023]|nr:hypothetical protein QZH41_013466 [Actinostola sp. cb2023]